MRAIYSDNTSTSFLLEKVGENSITAMPCYYSKTYPGIAWLRAPKFHSLAKCCR